MVLIYYTRPCFLDLSLSYASAISQFVDLHLIIEIAPENWQSSLFDLNRKKMKDGVINGIPFFKKFYPDIYDRYLKKCCSMILVNYNHPKSVHPTTFKVTLKAFRFFLSLAPDIIHFDDISLRTVLGIWRLRNLPILLSIHDPHSHFGEKNWRQWLARKIAFPIVDNYVLHSKAMKDVFIRKYKIRKHKKVYHLYLAPYTIFQHWITLPIMTNGKNVLFFGRLSPYKGLNILINAAP